MAADLLSTLVGGFLATGGGFIAKFYADWREENNLRSAFSGELRATLAGFDREEILPRVEKDIADMESGMAYTCSIFDLQKYNAVFLANASKLGVLRSPLPEKIVNAYSEVAAIMGFVEVLHVAASRADEGGKPSVIYDRPTSLKHYRALRTLLVDARASISDLINDLESVR